MVQILGFFVLAFPKAADQNKNEKQQQQQKKQKNGCRYCMPNAKISKYISIESKIFFWATNKFEFRNI